MTSTVENVIFFHLRFVFSHLRHICLFDAEFFLTWNCVHRRSWFKLSKTNVLFLVAQLKYCWLRLSPQTIHSLMAQFSQNNWLVWVVRHGDPFFAIANWILILFSGDLYLVNNHRIHKFHHIYRTISARNEFFFFRSQLV